MRRWILLCSCLIGVVGCGRAVPVSGRVTLDGQPLADATVTFIPDKETGGPGGEAKTDASGNFTLHELSTNSAGIRAGKYKVSISATSSDVGDSSKPKDVKDRVPAVYTGPGSTLSFDVPSGGTDKANFELKPVANVGKDDYKIPAMPK